MDYTALWYLVGGTATTIGGVWSLAWWFARQFANVKNVIYETKEAILSKLEYHEKHDDSRFAEVRQDIWEIRLRNATIDGRVEERERSRLQGLNEKKEPLNAS